MKREKDTVRLTLRVSPEVHQALLKASYVESRSMNAEALNILSRDLIKRDHLKTKTAAK